MIKLTKDDYVIFSFIFVTLVISLIFKLFPDQKKENFEIFPGYSLLPNPDPDSGLINYGCNRKNICKNCISNQIYKVKDLKISEKIKNKNMESAIISSSKSKEKIKCVSDQECMEYNKNSYCIFHRKKNQPYYCYNATK